MFSVPKIAEQLGCYIMPGGGTDPREGLRQARIAEEIGLGTVWLGERFDTKDFPSILGAASQVTERISLGLAVTPMNVRHPMVLASAGQTLQALTGNRFRMGFGRSADWRWEGYGIPEPKNAGMRDVAQLLRRLWTGEPVTYDGPAGNFPLLRIPYILDGVSPPPLYLAAVGPKTLKLGGAAYDGVILHPFLTPEAVAQARQIISEGAREAGKDPASVKVIAAVVCAPDLSEEKSKLAVHARGAGYFHVNGLGDMLVAANGWNADDLKRYRADPRAMATGSNQIDKVLSRQELIALTDAMPEHWIPSTSAIGTSAEVAAKLKEYIAAGADEILIHGSTADQLPGLVEAWNS
ncbi:MAG TPA: TIGR03857 family LLM class F420-dependent oxidoreductase [Novosphingobium sp.]